MSPGRTVRARKVGDLPALLTILQRSHQLHGYPVRGSAVREDRVVGHVALHPADAVLMVVGEQAD